MPTNKALILQKDLKLQEDPQLGSQAHRNVGGGSQRCREGAAGAQTEHILFSWKVYHICHPKVAPNHRRN